MLLIYNWRTNAGRKGSFKKIEKMPFSLSDLYSLQTKFHLVLSPKQYSNYFQKPFYIMYPEFPFMQSLTSTQQ